MRYPRTLAALAGFDAAWARFEATHDVAALERDERAAAERTADAFLEEGPAGNRREDLVDALVHGHGRAWLRRVVS